MKRVLLVFSLFFCSVMFFSCSERKVELLPSDDKTESITKCENTVVEEKETNKETSSVEKEESTDFGYYLDKISVLYEEGDNYKLYCLDEEEPMNFTSFKYEVYDNMGNLIDEGYNTRGFSFEEKDGLLQMNYTLFGTYQWRMKYYDLENGRVSSFFMTPLATNGELIVYFTSIDDEIVLVVQDIFDKSDYYYEISRDFSITVLLGESPIEFIDNKHIKISYWTEPNDEVVTEIITLP